MCRWAWGLLSAACLIFGVSSRSLAGGPFGRVDAGRDTILVDGAPIFLKGVCYSPYIGGDAPGGEIHHVDFGADLLEIRDTLHANAVRVYDPLPEGFYRAARDAGIWVIQGIFLPNPEAGEDLLAGRYMSEQKGKIADAIQRIHESGAEEVVLAYVIGNGLSTDVIARTIENNPGHARFQGRFYGAPPATALPRVSSYPGCADPPIQAFPDPHPFQSFLAELADHAAAADEALGIRHLIGYASLPMNSPFLGARDRTAPGLDLPCDMSFLDVVFENIFSYGYPYLLYNGFSSYIDRLKIAYPDTPVVVLETGYSTSRTAWPLLEPLCGFERREPLPLHLQFGGATEADQAAAIEERWVDVVTCRRPFAGFFVYELYDEWWLAGNPDVEDDHPLEHFGLKRVERREGNVTTSPKAAFAKVAGLYGCEEPDAPAGECGLVITSGRLLEGTYGEPLDIALGAAGGSAPYTWEADPPGAFPPGVRLEPSGRLEGTPERMGGFRFRLRVRDAGSPPLVRERLACLRIGPPLFESVGREIRRNGRPIFLKGIDYGPFIAGDSPVAPVSGVKKTDPFDDLRQIKEVLGANAIRVYQTLPKRVYDAARANGLFVIQGIHLQIDAPDPGDPEACRATQVDLLEPAFAARAKEHVLSEIDEVHAAEASDVILCYVVGNEMSFCAVVNTVETHQDQPRYQGTIYSAPLETRLPCEDAYPGCASFRFRDPHPVQSFVAELVDEAALRELEVYGERHLMAHATDPNTSIAVCSKDRYEPELHFPIDFGFLDIVFQNVYGYFPPYLRFVGYREYLEECAAAYPDRPFVILECGYSVSPRADRPGCAADPVCGQPETPRPASYCFGKNSEEEQALGLEAQWRNATSRPGLVSGFFVFEYFDEWWKGHERSVFVQDEDKAEEWFGIVAVNGTPDAFEVRKRPAFDGVREMFQTRLCLEADDAFRRGDPNLDGVVNISDAITGLNMLFLGESLTSCPAALDANDDEALDITDPIYLLNHLFRGGPPLPPPGIDECGPDPTGPSPGCCYPADVCS